MDGDLIMKTVLLMLVALFCATAILVPAVTEAEMLTETEGTVISSQQVYYSGKICWEVSVDVDGKTYTFYNCQELHHKLRLFLTMADKKIVSVKLASEPEEDTWLMAIVEILICLLGMGSLISICALALRKGA